VIRCLAFGYHSERETANRSEETKGKECMSHDEFQKWEAEGASRSVEILRGRSCRGFSPSPAAKRRDLSPTRWGRGVGDCSEGKLCGEATSHTSPPPCGGEVAAALLATRFRRVRGKQPGELPQQLQLRRIPTNQRHLSCRHRSRYRSSLIGVGSSSSACGLP